MPKPFPHSSAPFSKACRTSPRTSIVRPAPCRLFSRTPSGLLAQLSGYPIDELYFSLSRATLFSNTGRRRDGGRASGTNPDGFNGGANNGDHKPPDPRVVKLGKSMPHPHLCCVQDPRSANGDCQPYENCLRCFQISSSTRYRRRYSRRRSPYIYFLRRIRISPTSKVGYSTALPYGRSRWSGAAFPWLGTSSCRSRASAWYARLPCSVASTRGTVERRGWSFAGRPRREVTRMDLRRRFPRHHHHRRRHHRHRQAIYPSRERERTRD
jgi:hypothetical protein